MLNATVGMNRLTSSSPGGVATQVKMPKTVAFLPWEEAIAAPEFVMTDFGKFDRPPLWHLAFQVLHALHAIS